MLELLILLGICFTLAYLFSILIEKYHQWSFNKFIDSLDMTNLLSDAPSASSISINETETLTNKTKDFIPSPCFNSIEEYEDYIKNKEDEII